MLSDPPVTDQVFQQLLTQINDPIKKASHNTNGTYQIKTTIPLSDYKVIRRDGFIANFEISKITIAITKAFLAKNNDQLSLSNKVREQIENITKKVIQNLLRIRPNGGAFHVECIQDQVERELMSSGEHDIARAYILYREKRNQERVIKKSNEARDFSDSILIKNNRTLNVIDNGIMKVFDVNDLIQILKVICKEIDDMIDIEFIIKETVDNLYDGIPLSQIYDSMILAARTLIEKDPVYSQVTARILMHTIRKEVLGYEALQEKMQTEYINYFPKFIEKGLNAKLLHSNLSDFNLLKLATSIKAERDLQFTYLGLQTLYDRYFLHIQNQRIELPQIFFMRIAMGLAINESNKEKCAIQFYDILSSFDFMSSTPTLFNSGTTRPQLSSCYLTTIPDDLGGIYDGLKDNALLSKFAGGLGNDWTNVRALGSYINGTNGQSQGVVPFLKVVNDTAVAVNQGGKRKGAVCAYLETWHLDIEEFLELRKNTGDDRRRTHDMNTANWIPDLFMKRVMEEKEWTLFTPSSCPNLHEKFGFAFEEAYLNYEKKAENGEIKLFKKISAVQLWRKMLNMLFETGHPWITFKDPCNIRNPQKHVGTIHSSNLCTEITLNTSDTEIAVCNLGSINMVSHMELHENGQQTLNHKKLNETIRIAMRMLDNVIDINYYVVPKARNANLKHRPVGIGIMGFQDCLHKLRIPYASEEAIQFADESMEAICYYAYLSSTELAEERGIYSSYRGSLWDQGILPQDSMHLLSKERGSYTTLDSSSKMDWSKLRERIKKFGMRNSNCVAIAPTATISNIIGVSASIEPTYQNLFVKSNLSGEFTIINHYLIHDLKMLNLWDEVMIADLKYFDGSVSKIDRVPENLKHLYATAFEMDPVWLIKAASRRQKWIDQSQSLNIYMMGTSGQKLDEIYKLAWLFGLKTTYYLRTIAATHAEKSTIKKSLDVISNNRYAKKSIKEEDQNMEECAVCQ